MASLNIPVQFVPTITKLSPSDLQKAFEGVGDAIENAGKGITPLDPKAIQSMFDQLDREFKELNFDELEKDLIRFESKIDEMDFDGIGRELEKQFDSIDTSQLEKAINSIDDKQLDNVGGQFDKLFKGFKDFQFGDLFKKEVKATKAELESLLKVQKEALKEWDKVPASLRNSNDAYKNLKKEISDTESHLKQISTNTGALAKFNQTTMAVDQVSAAFQNFISVGNEYEATLAAVGAVTGFTGDALDKLGEGARDLAKTYGGSASSQLKSYQGILSKLGPQVADDTEALKSMANSVNILSAASGDDAQTSMSALVDTMLQLGLNTGTSAEQAKVMVRVADALAASAKVGAAEVPDVTQAVLQAGVAAKGAGLSVESFAAAIQVAAVGGKLGSEAGVGLRNVMGLIQKASGPAEEAMKKLGTSTQELGTLLTTQGLDAALGKLKAGLDTLPPGFEQNAAMMTIFGAENSAIAGILIDNLDKYKEFEDGIKNAVDLGAQGADGAIAQANARLSTADAINKRFVARVQDSWISIQQTIGSGASALVTTTAELAPTFTALTGLQTLIPDKAFTTVQTKLAGLSKSMGGLSGIASKLGPSLMNPYVLGTVAAGAALTYFFTQTERGQEIWKSLKDTAESVWIALKPLVEEGGKILGTWFDTLVSVGEIMYEVFIFPFQVSYGIFEALLDIVMDLFGGVEAGGDSFSFILDIMKGITTVVEFISEGVSQFLDGFRLGKDIVIAFVSGSKDILYAFVEFAATALNPANWLDGDLSSAYDKLSKAVEGTMKVAVEKAVTNMRSAKLGDALADGAALKADLDKNGKLTELVKKFKTAKTDIEKESIAKSIQEQVPGAVKSIGAVVDEQGKVIQQFEIAEDKVKAYAEAQDKALGAKAQKSAVQIAQGIEAQAVAYTNAQNQAKKLQNDIINAAKSGKDTSSLEERYKSVLDKVAEQGKKVSESISQASELNVPLTGLSLPPEFEQQVNAQMEKVAANLREKRIGDQLKSSIEIKGSLDTQNQIGKLVEQYKAAGTEAEKSDIAAKIRVNMPGAVKEIIKGVAANGELIKTLQVNTDEVEKNVAANKERFTGDLAFKQDEFQASIEEEGLLYQENITTLRGLADQIKESSDPKATEKLKKEYGELQIKVAGNKDTVISMAEKTKEFGATAEDVYNNVADSLGLSVDEAKELMETTKKVVTEASNAAKSVADMAKAFDEASASAKAALDTTKSHYQGLLFERQQLLKNKDIREEDRKIQLKRIDDQLKQARTEGKQQVDSVKNFNKLTNVTNELFSTEEKKGKEQKSQFERGKEKLSDEQKSQQIAEEQLKTDQDRQALLERRSRNALDEIRLEREKLDNLEQQKQDLKTIFGDLVKIDELGEVSVNVSSKLFKKDSEEKAELDVLIKDLNNNIKRSQNDVDSLRIKLQIDIEELEKQIREMKFNELDIDIAIGIKTEEDLVKLATSYLDDIYKKREKNYNDTVALEEEYEKKRNALGTGASSDAVETLELEYKTKKLLINKESIDLYEKEIETKEKTRSALKKINDSILSDSKSRYDREKEEYEKQFANQEAAASRLIDLQKEVRKQALDIDKENSLESIQKAEEERIKELDRFKKLEILSEEAHAEQKLKIQEEFNSRREEIEEENRRKVLVLDSLAQGAEKLRTLEHNEKLLSIEVNAKKEEYAQSQKLVELLEAQGLDNTVEKEKAKNLKAELTSLEDVYKEKGTALGVLTGGLTETINDTLGNIGNSEAVADSFRRLFATIAGALQAQLTGFVMSLVLSPSVSGYLAALPFPANVIALPLVTGIIRTAVNKATTPLLQSLLSFPTGGRVDTPTMFIAGDGSRLGESNREWIFRDSQLKTVMAETVNMGVPDVLIRLERIEQAILNKSMTFDGRDMRIGVNRAANTIAARRR